MVPSPSFWHQRYRTQAAWTTSLRQQAYQQAQASQARRILEVGSGTGVILSDLAGHTPAVRVGIDLDAEVTRHAHSLDPAARLAIANGGCLPFYSSAFDIVLCHYLLLWTPDPGAILREMTRVARPGGWVLCLAEPDYGGRIDHPAAWAELGLRQTESLRAQGADPNIGRTVRALLAEAGLVPVRSGVLGAEWTDPPCAESVESEWDMLRHDLEGRISAAVLQELEQQDLAAWQAGKRILYVPTFYALAVRPG